MTSCRRRVDGGASGHDRAARRGSASVFLTWNDWSELNAGMEESAEARDRGARLLAATCGSDPRARVAPSAARLLRPPAPPTLRAQRSMQRRGKKLATSGAAAGPSAEATAPAASAHSSSAPSPVRGQRVRIIGCEFSKELNGRTGCVKTIDEDLGLYGVQLEFVAGESASDQRTVQLGIENLTVIALPIVGEHGGTEGTRSAHDALGVAYNTQGV
eukprot:4462667-Prymnesium_polylepis.1